MPTGYRSRRSIPRRSFLRTSSRLVTLTSLSLALPTLDNLDFRLLRCIEPKQAALKAAAARQLLSYRRRGMFTAEAQLLAELELRGIFEIGVGILTLLEWFGFDWPHLRAKFASDKNARASFRDAYTGVAVSAVFDDQGKPTGVSTQYGDHPAIDLPGSVLGLIRGARALLLKNSLSIEEANKVAAISDFGTVSVEGETFTQINFAANDGFLLHHPETASVIVHFPPHTNPGSLPWGKLRDLA